MITLNGIARRSSKRNPNPPKNMNWNADIEKNKSIRIYGTDEGSFDKTFKVGDMAEYDSYNLSYYGEIVAITEKSVKIKARYGGQMYMLCIHDFIWRNHNWSLEKATKNNNEWYD